MAHGDARCRACGEPIWWLRHYATGKPAPIEQVGHGDGNIWPDLIKGTYIIVQAKQKEWFERYALHCNHFARCPQAAQFAKKSTS